MQFLNFISLLKKGEGSFFRFTHYLTVFFFSFCLDLELRACFSSTYTKITFRFTFLVFVKLTGLRLPR